MKERKKVEMLRVPAKKDTGGKTQQTSDYGRTPAHQGNRFLKTKKKKEESKRLETRYKRKGKTRQGLPWSRGENVLSIDLLG